ncbi:Ger(x)C family spore germination protein [Paenibacillus gansuensis]|uniref:Ger(X)C family spore germination protein n=1 Tax=Paenibacillus gansuensis TaxID=306542 RepID=A0ABW5PH49_9BACL
MSNSKHRKYKAIAYIPLLLFMFLSTSGCAKEQIINQVSLIQNIGIDTHKNAYKVTAAYATYGKETRMHILNGTAHTINESLISLTQQSDYPVAIGQTNTIFIHEHLARSGISDLASTIVRDPLVSNLSTIVIAKPKASTILSASSKYSPDFLFNLIKNNMTNGNIPQTNSHSFLDQYFGEGQDVSLPIIKIQPDGTFHINGVGVFRKDKLALLLSNDESLALKLLMDKKKTMSAIYEFKSDRNEFISYKIVNAKRRINMTNNQINISLKINADLRDYPKRFKIHNHYADIHKLRKIMESNLNDEVLALLHRLQKNKTDPVGFGKLARSNQRTWSEQAFMRSAYPKLTFIIKSEIHITQMGVGY